MDIFNKTELGNENSNIRKGSSDYSQPTESLKRDITLKS